MIPIFLKTVLCILYYAIWVRHRLTVSTTPILLPLGSERTPKAHFEVGALAFLFLFQQVKKKGGTFFATFFITVAKTIEMWYYMNIPHHNLIIIDYLSIFRRTLPW